MGMIIDLTKTQTNISTFPDGMYEAKVVKAEMKIAKSSGDPMVDLNWEIHHPELGNAVLRDNLSYNFPDKVKSFWLAANEMTEQDFQQAKAENPNDLENVEINPEEMIGLEMVIQMGEVEGKTNGQPNGKMYKNVVGSWYFPASRAESLVMWETPF